MTLEEAIKKIQPLDEEAMEYTRARWNTLGLFTVWEDSKKW